MDLEYQYLVGKLQEALASDTRVNAQDIRVVVTGGRIHLMGEVSTPERRLAVSEVAAEVLPGIPVRNELTVLDLAGGNPEPESITTGAER
jgi:osmotically-inducible protein OsmY